MSAIVLEPGWYTARRQWEPVDFTPSVVRLSQDEQGAVALVWMVGRRDPEPASEWKILDKVKINGDVRSLEVDRLQKEAHADGVLQGREAAAEEQLRQERANPVFTADLILETLFGDPDFREVGEPLLAVRLTTAVATSVDAALSDFLCWARGFKAALGPDDFDRMPMGIEAIRRIRETLNKAQRAAEKEVSR